MRSSAYPHGFTGTRIGQSVLDQVPNHLAQERGFGPDQGGWRDLPFEPQVDPGAGRSGRVGRRPM